VGLIAGAGGVHRLPTQIPLKQAIGLLLTGRQITAQEAYRLGLVNEVVPAAALMATAERWANEIMEYSPLSVRLTKEAALSGLSLPVEEAMRQDRPRLQRLFTSQDFVEGPLAGTMPACLGKDYSPSLFSTALFLAEKYILTPMRRSS